MIALGVLAAGIVAGGAAVRTPEDCARISAFHTLSLLLRILLRFKQRIEDGERCRLVEREHAHEFERTVIELVIEPMDESREM